MPRSLRSYLPSGKRCGGNLFVFLSITFILFPASVLSGSSGRSKASPKIKEDAIEERSLPEAGQRNVDHLMILDSQARMSRLVRNSANDPLAKRILGRAGMFYGQPGRIGTLERLLLDENRRHKEVIAELVTSGEVPDEVIFFNAQYLVNVTGASKTADSIRAQYRIYSQAGDRVLNNWLMVLNRSAKYAALGKSEETAYAIAQFGQEMKTGSRRTIERLDAIAADDAEAARRLADVLEKGRCL